MSAPAVFLHLAPGGEPALREISAGLEEEGVPCQVVAHAAVDGTAAALAHGAARTSPVGVGLGLDARHACLHLPQLAPDAPLVSLQLPHDAERLRALGHNAARLVKGAPLKELP